MCGAKAEQGAGCRALEFGVRHARHLMRATLAHGHDVPAHRADVPCRGDERQHRKERHEKAHLRGESFDPRPQRKHRLKRTIRTEFWFNTVPSLRTEPSVGAHSSLPRHTSPNDSGLILNTSTHIHTFPNGLTLVGEPMNKQAVAWNLLLPAGSATEPAGKDGLTSVLETVMYRGAGARNSRELSDALDDLGIARGGGADVESTSFGGATLGLYLSDALTIYADIVRRPRLPEDEWGAARDLALQSLQTLEDAPARKMFVQLRREWFTSAHKRSPIGTQEGLSSLSLEDLQADHAARFRPGGAILSVAGGFDFERLKAQVETLFGDWGGAAPALEVPQVVSEPLWQHIEQDTSQQQTKFFLVEWARACSRKCAKKGVWSIPFPRRPLRIGESATPSPMPERRPPERKKRSMCCWSSYRKCAKAFALMNSNAPKCGCHRV